MKNLLRLGLILASSGACSLAAPIFAIGDGAELFLTGGLALRADDNIFFARNNESDLIFDFTPGVELAFGKGARIQGTLKLADTFSNFSDISSLNTNLCNGDFVARYEDGKVKLGFNASFVELNKNTVDVRPPAGFRGFVRRDFFGLGSTAEIEVSQVTTLSSGFEYVNEDFKRAGYTDSSSLTFPVTAFYRLTPKTDVSVGYRYRDYRVDLGRDSKDHFFSVGARGEFSPKLSGKFALGLNTRKLVGGPDESQLGLTGSFTYEISPKTSFQFGGSNDFGTGARGEQQKNLILNSQLSLKISEEWAVNLGGLWRAIDFGTRTDDYSEVQLGASFIVSTKIRILASLVHRDYGSDFRVNEFKNNVFSIGAHFRY